MLKVVHQSCREMRSMNKTKQRDLSAPSPKSLNKTVTASSTWVLAVRPGAGIAGANALEPRYKMKSSQTKPCRDCPLKAANPDQK
jgi:hypothetical protein